MITKAKPFLLFLLVLMIAAVAGHQIVRWRNSREPRLTPDGEFCLLERASLTTTSGVTGYAPGTRVRLIRDHGNTMLVSHGQKQFEVPSDTLTNDIDLAELAAKRDVQSQRAYAYRLEEIRAAFSAEQLKQHSANMKRQQEIAANRPAEVSLASGALQRPAYAQQYGVARRPVIYDPCARYPEVCAQRRRAAEGR